jgi:hypothetical protein
MALCGINRLIKKAPKGAFFKVLQRHYLRQ